VTPTTTFDPDIGARFAVALGEVKDKLVHLVAELPLLVIALAIVLLSIWLGDVVSRRMRLVQRLSRHNPYMDGLARTTAKTVVIVAGLLAALNLLGATSLVGAVLGSAGVVGLVLGFGFKDIVENYIAGVLLSIRQPFNPGDLVRIDTYEGRVASLTSRATQLVTLDGNQLTLPNALVFKSVMLNYTHNPRRRFEFTTNVATSASWNEAMDLGIRTMRGIEGVLGDPAPTALIKELSDSAATIQYHGWIDQTRNDLSKTRSEAMRLVRRRLREAGITPPDGVQKVAMIRTDTGAPIEATPSESAHARDTSVDRTLDAQVTDAGERNDANLLKPDGDSAPSGS